MEPYESKELVVKDSCYGINYSLKPNLRKTTQNFEVISSNLERSGETVDDAWIFKMKKNFMT